MRLMLTRHRHGVQLNCFSPPVMIATFAIEVLLAVYTIWRYKLDVFGRLILANSTAIYFISHERYWCVNNLALLNTLAWLAFGGLSIMIVGTPLIRASKRYWNNPNAGWGNERIVNPPMGKSPGR